MHSSHEPFSERLNLLLASINRIRFIKRKQLSNHNKMALQLAQMVSRFSQKKTRKSLGKDQISACMQKEGEGKAFGGGEGERSSITRVNTSRPKFKIAAIKNKYMLQTTQEDSSLMKTTQQFEESLTHSQSNLAPTAPSHSRARPTQAKLQRLLEDKCNNYREMKEREQELELIRRLKSEQSQRVLRQRVAQAAIRKEEGRRKIGQGYFDYIGNVHAQKDQQKTRKNRLTQKKIEEMMKLQEEEKSQIEQFESSLALEQHLKAFLKEKLPLQTLPKGLSKQPFFS